MSTTDREPPTRTPHLVPPTPDPSALLALLDHAPFALAMFDREMRYLAVTKRWRTDYGLDGQHLIGRSHYEVFPDLPERWKESHRRALAGEAVHPDEDRFDRADGNTRWLRWDLRPWYDPAGQVGGVLLHTEDVTAQRRAEEAVRRERDFNQAIIHTAQMIVLLLDPDGRVLRFNPYFERLTGWRLDEVQGQSWFDTFLPEGHREDVRTVFHRALGGEPTRGNVNPVLTRAGERLDVEWYDVQLHDADGRLIGLLSVGQDVTERRKAAEKLRKSEEQLRSFLENSATIAWMKDAEGRHVYLSPNYERRFGVTSDDLCGRTDFDLWPAEVAETFRRNDRAVLTTGRPIETVEETPEAGGGTAYWLSCKFPYQDELGRWYVGGLGVDITRRIHAEQALREREESLRAILDTASDAIISIDEHGLIRMANAATARLFGYPADELLGRNVSVLMPDPYREAHDEYLARYLRTGERRIIGIGREVVARRKDGSTFPVELSVAEWTGTPRRFTGFVRDVTDRKELEARFLRAQRLESIGSLASGIAHDLNNVLTPVLVAVKLLLKDRPGIDRKALLQTAQASVERGAGMIRQLLTFGGGVTGERVPVAVGELVREVHGLLEHTFPKSIAFTLSVGDNLWPAVGDPTQLTQVLMNLCVNGRDAMPAGGTLAIRVANHTLNPERAARHPGARPGRYVHIAVSDTGTGMTPEVQARIFDPFFTTKPFGQGTGLGLATVQGIVKSHGGFVGVYSELGKGTRFSVYLPAAELPTNGSAAGGAAADYRGGGRLILVVDDEAAVRTVARAALEGAGYRVATAASGVEAMEWYGRHRGEVAAVVLDMMMPGLDGPAVIARLRATDPSILILAASGLPPAGRDAEVLAAERVAFLPKPYSDDELLTALAALFRTAAAGP